MSSTSCRTDSRTGSPWRDSSFVAFVVADGDYAVNVGEVHGIYRGLPVVPDPDGPQFMEGSVQFSGRRIPVLNLRRFASLAENNSDPSARWILMVSDGASPVGLVVDRVTEVVRIEPENLRPASDTVQCPVGDYVAAIASHRGKSIFVPDFNRLVHDAIYP
ncbi:chemotaxis protein CheW [bacterium]|nr:chemotaxis protein CheW [bacterium]MBU1983509.1 chemotaxis protein CheW [bacterium]